jgi:hypothetical protein
MNRHEAEAEAEAEVANVLLLVDVHIHNSLPLFSLTWTESAGTTMVPTMRPNVRALLRHIVEIEAEEAGVVGVRAEVEEAPIRCCNQVQMFRLQMCQQGQIFATLANAHLLDPA